MKCIYRFRLLTAFAIVPFNYLFNIMAVRLAQIAEASDLNMKVEGSTPPPTRVSGCKSCQFLEKKRLVLVTASRNTGQLVGIVQLKLLKFKPNEH